MKDQRDSHRKSERELIFTRMISAPQELVFKFWTDAELFKKWWVPKSAPIELVSCEFDIRKGGNYRLMFKAGDQNAEFFGKYLEVTPNSRLVWTNDEGGAEAANVTTVTFEDFMGKTKVLVHDIYPSKESLDEAITSGSSGAMPEQLEQLEHVISLHKSC